MTERGIMISKFQKETTILIRSSFPQYDVIGWPGPELNLGHLAGLKNTNLRADIFIWKDINHGVVVECHSSLHDEKGKAWNESREDRLERLARDDLKIQLCSRLNIGFVEIWPKTSKESILEKVQKVLDTCPTIAVQIKEKEYPHIIWQRKSMESLSRQKLSGGSLPISLPMVSNAKMPKGKGFK
jgi:hypothetical protein